MVAALGLGVGFALAQALGLTPLAQDAAVYWRATPGHLYAAHYAIADAPFTYSPAFADALAPLRLIPLRWFDAAWQAGLVAVLVVTIRGWSLPVLALDLALVPTGSGIVLPDIAMGNVQVLLGAVAVFGLRWPALWSFALLSKVTPGVGLVWFVARREWRNLAVALGVTAAIAAVSLAILPGDWFAWARFLTGGSPDFPLWTVPVPLWARLASGATLVWWGARTDRAWVVPLAVGWCIPIAYPTMTAAMVAALGAQQRPKHVGEVVQITDLVGLPLRRRERLPR